VAERLALLAADELLLIWLLGEAGAPLTVDELGERAAAWRPLGRPQVLAWIADAAGRDIVMHLSLLALGHRGAGERFALTPAGAAIAARLRAAAAHDAQRLRVLLRVAPAATEDVRGALPDVARDDVEDWLAFAYARGLLRVLGSGSSAVWELTFVGRREAGRGAR
jgi:hypothetical protein